MQPHGRELGGRVGQEARQLFDAHGRHRARGGELAAQLVEIGLLAADADRHRDRHGQQAGILRAEEGSKKPGQVSAV